MKYPTQEELKPTITLRKEFYKRTNDLQAALLMSQLDYWFKKTKDLDGWVYKTQEELQEEVFLTPYQQRRARKILREANLIEEKCAGLPRKIYFRIKVDIDDGLEDQNIVQQEVQELHNNNENNLKNEDEKLPTNDAQTELIKIDEVDHHEQNPSPHSIIYKITHENTSKNTTKITHSDPCWNMSTVDKVFSHWKSVMNQHDAKMDKNRKELIKNSLDLGYSEEQLCQAISGCAVTPYNMGINDRGEKYVGLHTILKDADQIDRFIAHFHSPPKKITVKEKLAIDNGHVAENWLNSRERKKDYEIQ
ncbi:MAG: hypothetical protein JSS07_03855 [Proteobacteria bacterium]|nr:hypothetical protein [Pseudomonadota bacterium]